MKQTELIVQNLKCGGCANTILKQLSTLKHISNIAVEPELSLVSFNYANDSDLVLVKNKLKQLGYPVDGDSNSYMNKAKSFVSCATGKRNQ